MKMGTFVVCATFLCLGGLADASPYFRLLDPAHPKVVAGALLAPNDLKETSAAALVPLFTHSPADGCFLKSLGICEAWTPLAVGASMNEGKITFDAAPLANVLPWFQKAVAQLAPASWTAAHAIFDPGPNGPTTFSAGPVWEYRQAENKGYFRVYTGLALQF